MDIKEALNQAEILKVEIEGCKYLQDFYKAKQETLEKEIENLLNRKLV